MGQLIAIPFAMKMLADMGAQVVRLESTQRLESYRSDSVYKNDVSGDFWNKGANFYEQNRNKLGVTLDLSKPEGSHILRELISVSDIFAENFTPRVIKNFGLEYEELRKIKPDIIINCIGYTDVINCEINKIHAIKLNTLSVYNIISSLRNLKKKTHLINIYTDQMYNNKNSLKKNF